MGMVKWEGVVVPVCGLGWVGPAQCVRGGGGEWQQSVIVFGCRAGNIIGYGSGQCSWVQLTIDAVSGWLQLLPCCGVCWGSFVVCNARGSSLPIQAGSIGGGHAHSIITWDYCGWSSVCVGELSVSGSLYVLEVVATQSPRSLRLEPWTPQTQLPHP